MVAMHLDGRANSADPPAASELSPRERRIVFQHVALDLLGNLSWALMDTALNMKLLRIAKGDVVALAKANTVHWSLNAVLQLFIRPIGAALSDKYGRKYFIVLNRLSMISYFAGSFLARSLNEYIAACICCFGILWPMTGSAQLASWSDIFASRPELSSRTRAKYQTFAQHVMGFGAPVLGAVITSYHATAGFFLAMGGCVAQAAVACTMDETLDEDKRKPFSLAVANPISNALLLFTNGPGLRGLAISHAWFDVVGTIWSTMEPYRLGMIGWTPANQSFYHSFMSGVNIFINKFISQPLLNRLGNRKSYYCDTLLGGVGYLTIGQACRPVGASVLRKTVQYTAGDVCMQVAVNPIDDMIVKQGITVTDAGNGQIRAAQEGLNSLMGIISPIIWSSLFALFNNRPKGSLLFLLFGPGGHCVVAGLSRFMAAYTCWSIKAEHLFIADTDDPDKIRPLLTADKVLPRGTVVPK